MPATRSSRQTLVRLLALLAAADVKYRSGAVFYKFHQDSDFFYLTGMLVWKGEESKLTDQDSTSPKRWR